MGSGERWDIFCRIIDNFGDAAVCWRLARELTHEHHARVRLWIDDLAPLKRLVPQAVDAPSQVIDAVEIVRWSHVLPSDVTPAHIVIDAFGAGLPDEYVRAMAQAPGNTVWVILEYLTAERWAAQHHGLPSPHPQFAIQRFFFFPGFTEHTGGVLRERDLLARRDAFHASRRSEFWRELLHAPPAPDALAVSVFMYNDAPLADLLTAWERGDRHVVAAVTTGAATDAAVSHFGLRRVPTDRTVRHGPLEVRFVPFLSQRGYDELLWTCDLNFVRGEDSFVRAQWASHPFVWHAYPQSAPLPLGVNASDAVS
jgi:uncharacterized repeat protein (TIGR03837 family)